MGQSDRVRIRGSRMKNYTKLDIVKDIIFFFITVAVAYGYILLLLLILSFMTSRYLPMKFDDMLVYSGIGTVIIGVWYIVKKVRKYQNKTE